MRRKENIRAEDSELSENLSLTQQTEVSPENQGVSATTVLVNKTNDTVNQVEDAVMKVMMEVFSEEMLPLFGITQKATALVPTEEVHLELKKGYQDFNLAMEDGSIAHFEFQSKNGGTKDLRRFRAYEMNLSYQLQKPVAALNREAIFESGLRPAADLKSKRVILLSAKTLLYCTASGFWRRKFAG